MDLTQYENLVRTTLYETYPLYLIDRIVKKLEAKGIISLTEDLMTQSKQAIFTPHATSIEKVMFALDQNKGDTLKEIELMEYERPYRYSSIFNTSGIDEQVFETLKQMHVINDIIKPEFVSDVVFKENQQFTPSFFQVNGDISILKFNLEITGFLPVANDNRRDVKYPVLAIFYIKENVVEIRLDSIKGFLKNGDEYFYSKKIKLISKWLQDNLSLDMEPMNLSPIIDYLIKETSTNQETEVTVSAQAMNLQTGSKVVLDTGKDDNLVLPLLGELKNLIKENEDLFLSNKETLELKEKLETFVMETEDGSDLPWISLTWKNEKKNKSMKIKFLFNYQGQDFSLLQYYYSNADMERMAYVTKYLINNQSKFNKTIESTSISEPVELLESNKTR